MKIFLSDKAGAAFFCGANRTIVYHADSVEYIMKIGEKDGKAYCFAHIFAMYASEKEVLLFCNWNPFLSQLEMIKDMSQFLGLMSRSCPKMVSVFTGKHPLNLRQIRIPDSQLEGFAISVDISGEKDMDTMKMPFIPAVSEAAEQLANACLEIYMEIENNSPLDFWKKQLQTLWG